MHTLARSIRSAAVGMLLLSFPVAASAQGPDAPGVSPRIRISATSPVLNGATGRLIARDSAGLTFVRQTADVPPDTFRVAADAITNLEISKGRNRGVVPGALFGGLVFGMAGLAMAGADGCGGGACSGPTAGNVVSMTVFGAGFGAVMGMLIGRERWEPASEPISSSW